MRNKAKIKKGKKKKMNKCQTAERPGIPGAFKRVVIVSFCFSSITLPQMFGLLLL